MKINNHENYVDNNNIEQQVASYQRENINQERAHCQKITEEINLVFFFPTEAIQLKCDGTR